MHAFLARGFYVSCQWFYVSSLVNDYAASIKFNVWLVVWIKFNAEKKSLPALKWEKREIASKFRTHWQLRLQNHPKIIQNRSCCCWFFLFVLCGKCHWFENILYWCWTSHGKSRDVVHPWCTTWSRFDRSDAFGWKISLPASSLFPMQGLSQAEIKKLKPITTIVATDLATQTQINRLCSGSGDLEHNWRPPTKDATDKYLWQRLDFLGCL